MGNPIVEEFQALRPAGGYRVILADPPWSYDNWSNNGEQKNPNAHYDCMTQGEISLLPVEILAADDCALFMWVTWPLMPLWNKVLQDWGFTFAGLAWEWIKYNPDTDKYFMGLGYGTRKNLEPCILATRGNPSLRKDSVADLLGAGTQVEGVKSVRDFIQAHPHDCIRARRREHSRKPDEQYTRIETLFDGPYIELFARQKRNGWNAWGNEVDKFQMGEVG